MRRRRTRAVTPALVALAASLSCARVAPGEEGAAAAERDPPGATGLEARKKALEGWVHEPVAIDASAFRFLLDRRDGSFVMVDRPAGERHYSSWSHRGFASLRLRDGSVVALDRIEKIDVTDRRVSFEAAPAEGGAPPVRFEVRSEQAGAVWVLEFEVPEDAREIVRSVRVLDGAFWLTDSDEGGLALPRGAGEWYAAGAGKPVRVRLTGFPPFAPAGESYSIPLVAGLKGKTAFVLYWQDATAAVEIERREVPGDRFPGRTGLFLSCEFPGPEGAVYFAPVAERRLELSNAFAMYRDLNAGRVGPQTLRYKTGIRSEVEPPLGTLLGALVLRMELTGAPVVPLARGPVRYRFEDVVVLAERLRDGLEIDQALFLLDGWIGSGRGATGELLPPAEECGGAEGLASCSAQLGKMGYLLGLAVDRDQLIDHAGDRKLHGEEAWREAIEWAQNDNALAGVKRRYGPQLVCVRSTEPEPLDSFAAIEERAALSSWIAETFGLHGASPGSELDIAVSAYLEGPLSSKVRAPSDTGQYPVFTAVYGRHARLALDRDHALSPSDAAGFLAHLICGEVPVVALPARTRDEEEVRSPTGPDGAFARAGGWTADKGLAPWDVYVKNVYEVASPLARLRAREPLLSHRSLTPDGGVQESYFGLDLRIVVNLNPEPYEDRDSGCLLPRYGFVIRHPFFYAFHALRAGGVEYDEPALFTVRSLGSKMYLRAEKTRIYHGFGPSTIGVGARRLTVETESVLSLR